jgi:hypothetical protein
MRVTPLKLKCYAVYAAIHVKATRNLSVLKTFILGVSRDQYYRSITVYMICIIVEVFYHHL